MDREFERLLALGSEADVTGWGFDWLDGRATEQRPAWGYSRTVSDRLATATASLDIQTGGGEVLAEASDFPPVAVATESWPPNLTAASQLLHPRGVVVVSDPDEPPLPFADESFDLVTSRHPATVWWDEITRVLRPGGTYLAQHIGPASMFELIEFFLGPQPDGRRARNPTAEAAAAKASNLEIVDLQTARLRVEIYDVAAVVYLLRKVIWWVPGFSVESYRDALYELHEKIRADGAFIAHSTRHLIDARKPIRETTGRT